MICWSICNKLLQFQTFKGWPKLKGAKSFSIGWRKFLGRKLEGAKIKGRRKLKWLRYGKNIKWFRAHERQESNAFYRFRISASISKYRALHSSQRSIWSSNGWRHLSRIPAKWTRRWDVLWCSKVQQHRRGLDREHGGVLHRLPWHDWQLGKWISDGWTR